jgi:hypothetical protein
LVDKAGNPVALNIVDAQGSPVALPAGVGYYDFAWDEASQTLLVSDFAARNVYVLRAPADATCPCDSPANVNCDDSLNFFDVLAYTQQFNAGDPGADLAAPIGTLNFFDFLQFISLFNQGCP